MYECIYVYMYISIYVYVNMCTGDGLEKPRHSILLVGK